MILSLTSLTVSTSTARSRGRRPGIGWTPLAVILCLAVLAPVEAAAQTATLAVGSASGNAGASVDLTVSFTPGATGVATMQFDLTYPSALAYVSTTTGSAAAAAGKSASSSAITGGVRVLVFGLNQNVIGAGAVAVVRLTIASGTAPQTFPVTISGITASDPDANPVSATGTNGSVTVTLPPDTTPPVISNVSASNITATGATISWTTNEASDTQVEYGTTTAYGSSTALNSSMVTSHSQNLTGLSASTLYHYRVKSRDAAGNLATSGDYTFTTAPAPDTTPPVISNVSASNITATGATISWTTNEASDTQVEYGTTNAYGSMTSLDADMTTSHSQKLEGLAPATLYHFRVRSSDAAQNLAVSQDFTFTTAASDPDKVKKTFFVPRRRGKKTATANGESREYTGLALVNLDSGTARLSFTACDSSGALISGTDIANPVTRSLDPGRQLPIVDTELFGAGISLHDGGWIKVESDVAAVAGFFMIFDGSLDVLDGAVLNGSPAASFILSEIEPDGFTHINIENPSAREARLTLELVGNGGNVLASEQRAINAGGSLEADPFEDLFEGIVPAASSYLRVRSDQPVVPLELTGKEGIYTNALNGLDASKGAPRLYCPQYAVGGPWRTAISLVNLDARAGMVTFRFVPQDPSQPIDTRSATINSYGKLFIDDPGFFETLAGKAPEEIAQGYLLIESDGIRLAGSVAFGDTGRSGFSSTLPLVQSLENSLLFAHVATNDTYFTGLAVVNPHDTDIFVVIDLFGADGRIEASTTQIVPPKGRTSRLLTQYFPALAGQNRSSGYIRVTANMGVAGFALFGTNNLSVLSAIPPQAIP